MTDKRLIEVAFPLRKASIDSVHEKNVRHGHISTLHIWPACRPLAACRAALIATLLPDPGDDEARRVLLERLGGKLAKTTKKKMPNGRVEEIDALETQGGVLHWGRESGPDMDWFREETRKAYGGRAARVLDPFAGGGAIRWRRCASAARSPRRTSTRWPGSSSSARWTIPSPSRARLNRCRTSPSRTGTSWQSTSRRPRA